MKVDAVETVKVDSSVKAGDQSSTPTPPPAPSKPEELLKLVEDAKPAESVETKPATPAPEEKKPEAKKPDDFANKFGILAKKERALQKEQAEWKPKIESAKKFEDAQANAKKDPLAYLAAVGLTYEDITEFVVNDKKPTPSLETKAVEDKIKALEKERSDEKEAAKKKAVENAITKFRGDIAEFVKTNAETHELVSLSGDEAQNLIYDVVEDHYEKHQKVLPIAEAAKAVEDYLEKRHQKLAAAKKLQPKPITPKVEETKASKQDEDGKQEPTTLNNNLTPTGTKPVIPRLSDEERLKQAATLLKWD